jgi:mono/diheme cytochrome c family protein
MHPQRERPNSRGTCSKHQRRPSRPVAAMATALSGLALFFVSSVAFGDDPRAGAAAVAAHRGPSWLRALAISVDSTHLGHMGGPGEPPAYRADDPLPRLVERALAAKEPDARKILDSAFTVDGDVIYRLNCRSCHGPAGEGAAPEVSSLRGMAGALSPDLVARNMKEAGHPVHARMAKDLSYAAESRLRERLWEGGKVMPAFKHLTEEEQVALLDYLKGLAGGRPATPARAPETVARLGELVVEGTCRVCHDATGPVVGHIMMVGGRMPALANIPEQMSLEAVVHKVRHGWTAVAGLKQTARMPLFSYMTDEEVAAAYLYLAYYPPTE